MRFLLSFVAFLANSASGIGVEEYAAIVDSNLELKTDVIGEVKKFETDLEFLENGETMMWNLRWWFLFYNWAKMNPYALFRRCVYWDNASLFAVQAHAPKLQTEVESYKSKLASSGFTGEELYYMVEAKGALQAFGFWGAFTYPEEYIEYLRLWLTHPDINLPSWDVVKISNRGHITSQLGGVLNELENDILEFEFNFFNDERLKAQATKLNKACANLLFMVQHGKWLIEKNRVGNASEYAPDLLEVALGLMHSIDKNGSGPLLKKYGARLLSKAELDLLAQQEEEERVREEAAAKEATERVAADATIFEVPDDSRHDQEIGAEHSEHSEHAELEDEEMDIISGGSARKGKLASSLAISGLSHSSSGELEEIGDEEDIAAQLIADLNNGDATGKVSEADAQNMALGATQVSKRTRARSSQRALQSSLAGLA